MRVWLLNIMMWHLCNVRVTLGFNSYKWHGYCFPSKYLLPHNQPARSPWYPPSHRQHDNTQHHRAWSVVSYATRYMTYYVKCVIMGHRIGWNMHLRMLLYMSLVISGGYYSLRWYFHKAEQKATRWVVLHQTARTVSKVFSPDTSTDKTTIQKQCNTPCSIIWIQKKKTLKRGPRSSLERF